MQYLLAGVLVVVAAGATRTDGLVGKTINEVHMVMGEPTRSNVFISEMFYGTFFDYEQTDCLGGRREVFIHFGGDDRVKGVSTSYHPFATCPPWLEAIRIALAPAGK